MHRSDGVGVRDRDRGLELSGFLDPTSTGEFAVAVEDGDAGGTGDVRRSCAARQDRCHPGAGDDRLFGDERLVSDLEAGDVRDRIPFSGHAVERHPEFAGSDRWLMRLVLRIFIEHCLIAPLQRTLFKQMQLCE
jgi:hypothetical protein